MCIYLLCLYQLHWKRQQQQQHLQVLSVSTLYFCTNKENILLTNDQGTLTFFIHVHYRSVLIEYFVFLRVFRFSLRKRIYVRLLVATGWNVFPVWCKQVNNVYFCSASFTLIISKCPIKCVFIYVVSISCIGQENNNVLDVYGYFLFKHHDLYYQETCLIDKRYRNTHIVYTPSIIGTVIFFCVVFDLIKDVICPFSLTLHFDNFQCLSFCIGTTNKTQERKTERDRDKKDINTIIRYRHYIKILVILAGTVLSLTLLLLIAREIFKLLQMSETSGDYQASMDAYVVNYTSGDITESLYNSRGTQE